MSQIDVLFPSQELFEAEEIQLKEFYSQSVIHKHLRIMALNEIKELATISVSSMTPEHIAQSVSKLQGRLDVISTLLSISQQQTKE